MKSSVVEVWRTSKSAPGAEAGGPAFGADLGLLSAELALAFEAPMEGMSGFVCIFAILVYPNGIVAANMKGTAVGILERNKVLENLERNMVE